MDVMNELLDPGSVDPALLAELLRRKEQVGTALAMSGSKRGGALGADMAGGAMETAAGIGKGNTATGLARWEAMMKSQDAKAARDEAARQRGLDRASREGIAAANRDALLRRALAKAGKGVGSPEDAMSAKNDKIAELEDIAGLADRAIEQSSGWSTGLRGQILSNVGGTDARNLQATLQPLLSGEAMAKLNSLREYAQSVGAKGSGLGQITEKELNLLMNAYRSLDQAQTEEQLDSALTDIANRNREIANKLRAWVGKQQLSEFDDVLDLEGYDEELGGVPDEF